MRLIRVFISEKVVRTQGFRRVIEAANRNNCTRKTAIRRGIARSSYCSLLATTQSQEHAANLSRSLERGLFGTVSKTRSNALHAHGEQCFSLLLFHASGSRAIGTVRKEAVLILAPFCSVRDGPLRRTHIHRANTLKPRDSDWPSRPRPLCLY